jgi:hypothetical protein
VCHFIINPWPQKKNVSIVDSPPKSEYFGVDPIELHDFDDIDKFKASSLINIFLESNLLG